MWMSVKIDLHGTSLIKFMHLDGNLFCDPTDAQECAAYLTSHMIVSCNQNAYAWNNINKYLIK